jgi:prephenate dehydratase
MEEKNIVIQGYHGSFHDVAAREYMNGAPINIIPASSFDELARTLSTHHSVDFGLIAIENSIAGSLLQNYRILRENHFWISGEIYLRIQHNLMAISGQNIRDIYELRSHPMAINQCLHFLKQYPHIRLIEAEDTALSAKEISEQNLIGSAAIASNLAANLYNLDILAENIETSKVNYTRFFVVQRRRRMKKNKDWNKATIYLRVTHDRGSLLKVLQRIHDHKINMSKLQSYPVLGKMSEYFFHIDLIFDDLSHYESLMENLLDVTIELEELGIYQRALNWEKIYSSNSNQNLKI